MGYPLSATRLAFSGWFRENAKARLVRPSRRPLLLHPCGPGAFVHSPGEARPTPVRLVVGPAHRHAVGGVSVRQ